MKVDSAFKSSFHKADVAKFPKSICRNESFYIMNI